MPSWTSLSKTHTASGYTIGVWTKSVWWPSFIVCRYIYRLQSWGFFSKTKICKVCFFLYVFVSITHSIFHFDLNAVWLYFFSVKTLSCAICDLKFLWLIFVSFYSSKAQIVDWVFFAKSNSFTCCALAAMNEMFFFLVFLHVHFFNLYLIIFFADLSSVLLPPIPI